MEVCGNGGAVLLEGYFVELEFGGHRIMTCSCESSTKETSNLGPEDA